MALIKEQRLIDSNKRALIKYIILGNGTQNSNTVLVDVSTLALALNANGQIMASNTHPKSLYRTTIKRCAGTLSSNGNIKIQWHGDANGEVVFVGSGSFDYDFQSMGDGAVITNPEANSSGDILITTSSLVAGEGATIILDLRKDSRDYDAGQTADPYAFNRVS
jgi:hypothetical protein